MIRRKSILFLIFVLIFYFTGFILAFLINSDFSRLEVFNVKISGKQEIAALCYKPKVASMTNPFPAVILSHGISGSKEMMSHIALELAKNGFVALSIDLVGHGDSEGSFGVAMNLDDFTLGIGDAVEYLTRQSFVNSSKIGLIGHSLGAGAVRATTLTYEGVRASIFIGGGLGENIQGSEYGVLNSTFPKNLLIVIGKHDVLFDLEQTKLELKPVFGNVPRIINNEIYGNFSESTARSLVVPNTTHLFEPADPSTVPEVVSWMNKALKESSTEKTGLTYLSRELAVVIGLTSFIILVFPISSIFFDYFPSPKKMKDEYVGTLKDWQLLTIWGILSLVLFFPMFFIGSQIPFPPLIFGNSFSWWLFSIGTLGLIIGKTLLTKYLPYTVNLKSIITQSFTPKNIKAAIIIFLILYTIIHITQTILLIDFRIIVIPIFKKLNNTNRIISFFTLIPFYLLFFFVEGIYFHKFHSSKKSNDRMSSVVKTVAIKIAPYLILVLINYLPMFLFDFRVFPSFIGFIMEFILGIIPLFVLTIIYSWWFYKKTDNLGIGTILNTLLFAWTSATIFPISI